MINLTPDTDTGAAPRVSPASAVRHKAAADAQARTPEGREYLTFHMSGHEYAMDIMRVREIRGWTRATPMPHAPAFMKGVINLRGTVLPVMDLSVRMGMEALDGSARNVIIVVSLEQGMTGLLVDAVSDIVTLADSDMQLPPDLGGDPGARMIRALRPQEDGMIRILDLDAIAAPTDESGA